MLKDTWEFYLPDIKFERKTNEWQKMGFQGADPTTDF